MIQTTSEDQKYSTRFSDGVHVGVADTTADKGGAHAGFRPHDLLEAALAVCVNMTVRMFAENHGIPLRSVATQVELDRSQPDATIFRYSLTLEGDLTPEQRDRLEHAATACPVRKTLSKSIRFEKQ